MDSLLSLFPYYPDPNAPDLPADFNLSDELLKLKEFNELLDITEEKDENGFKTFQIFVQRFMNPITPYKTLLVKHSMGSGKTCIALLVIVPYYNIYNFLYEHVSLTSDILKYKSIILSKNPLQVETIKNSIDSCIKFFKSPNIQKILRNAIEKYVIFATFEEVKINQNESITVCNTQLSSIINNLALVVIDEVHTVYNEREQYEFEHKMPLYSRIMLFTEKLKEKNVKILLMSGTPVSNHYIKLFQIMDLILPEELKFTKMIGKDIGNIIYEDDPEVEEKDDISDPEKYAEQERIFDNYLFDEFDNIRFNKKEELIKRFSGRISCLDTSFTSSNDSKKIEIGGYYNYKEKHIQDEYVRKQTSYTKVFVNYMEGYQLEKYIETVSKSDMINFFAAPENFIINNHIRLNSDHITFNDNKILGTNQTFKELLSDHMFLKTHCILYYNILVEMGVITLNLTQEEIQNRNKEAVFIFNDFVEKGGNKLFSLILIAHGYKPVTRMDITNDKLERNSFNVGKRFAILSSNPNTIKEKNQTIEVLKAFAHRNNKYGDFVRVIIGSKKIAFGYDLTNGRQAHIVLQWNAPIMNQAIARLFRGRSNYDIKEENYVKVYRHIVSIKKRDIGDRDIPIHFEKRLKKVEEKETKNAKILHIVDSTAVDRPIHFKYHTSNPLLNYTYQCNFLKCEENYSKNNDLKSKSSETIEINVDNLFLFHENEFKLNLLKEFMTLFWLGKENHQATLKNYNIKSVSFSTLKQLFDKSQLSLKNKLHRLSNNDFIHYLNELICKQYVFLNPLGIPCVMGNLKDVIFLKNKLFINHDMNIIYEIISELKIQSDITPFMIDEAFILNEEKDKILSFFMCEDIDKYIELSVFSKVFIFEFLNTMSIENEKFYTIKNLINKYEHKNFITQCEYECLNDDNITSYSMFHKILSEYHIKESIKLDCRREDFIIEGIRGLSKSTNEWKNIVFSQSILQLLGKMMIDKKNIVEEKCEDNFNVIPYWYLELERISSCKIKFNYLFTYDSKINMIKRHKILHNEKSGYHIKQGKGIVCNYIKRSELQSDFIDKYITCIDDYYHLIEHKVMNYFIKNHTYTSDMNGKKIILSSLEELKESNTNIICDTLYKMQEDIFRNR